MISIVITSFNYERYIGETIRSALEQEGAETEVIVVDDGSSDGSRGVIESFGERVTTVFGANRGQAAAQNTGYELGRGEGVIFLDSDDVLLPSAARSVADALADTRVAKVHWTLPVIDAHGRRTGMLQDRELAEGDLRRHFFEDGPLSNGTMPSPPTSGNAYARWFLEQVMPTPEDVYFRSPDEYLFGLAPAYGSIARIKPQSLYRIHGNNTHLLRPFEQMLSFQLKHYATMLREGRRAAVRAGVSIDLATWDGGAWWPRTAHVVETIERVVPEGERFALSDETLLGFEPQLRGRTVLPFPEHDGEWAGNPVDDADALGRLERLRAERIPYLAVAWPAFWWFEEYPGFARQLREQLSVIVEDDDLVLFGPKDR
ncbi:MAG TPA: glycosyltransferase family 2 protein [Solirubrobacteraceae bacterium]|nr:glycosyltransferase family 2 protein [Solirubrobacteraceae bacterium]